MAGEELRTECCFALRSEPHYSFCSANVDVEKVNDSFMRDKQRWTESYVERSSQAVRRRVLAEKNGHG